jgi:hypothetical protein
MGLAREFAGAISEDDPGQNNAVRREVLNPGPSKRCQVSGFRCQVPLVLVLVVVLVLARLP